MSVVSVPIKKEMSDGGEVNEKASAEEQRIRKEWEAIDKAKKEFEEDKIKHKQETEMERRSLKEKEEFLDKREQELKKLEESITRDVNHPSTSTASPRPSLLCGTSVTSKKFIFLLYAFMQVVFKPKAEKNADLVFFRDGIPLGAMMSYLDPLSFLRMSATCKRLREFCLRSRQIDIPSQKYYLEVDSDDENDLSITMKRKIRTDDGIEKVLINVPLFNHMKKLPIRFRFKISAGNHALSIRNLKILQNFLTSFRLFSMKAFSIWGRRVIDWPAVISFLERIPVSKFYSGVSPSFDVLPRLLRLPVEDLTLPDPLEVSLLENVCIPNIDLIALPTRVFSTTDMGWLVENWLQRETSRICKWSFPCNFKLKAFFNFFKSDRFIALEEEETPTEPAEHDFCRKGEQRFRNGHRLRTGSHETLRREVPVRKSSGIRRG